MTPEGQMCRDILGELESQWERAGPLAKVGGAAVVPNLLVLCDALCDRLDALEAPAVRGSDAVTLNGATVNLADLEQRRG